jgi:hypothetical protein
VLLRFHPPTIVKSAYHKDFKNGERRNLQEEKYVIQPNVYIIRANNFPAPVSKHSREARRATSPGIDTDKSLKNVKPPSESIDHRPSILAIHQGAGVTKKSKRGRNLSSRARRRAEKDQDKAVAVLERKEKKIAKSKGSSRNIQFRRKAWEEINKTLPLDKQMPGEAEDDDDEEEVSEFDDEMDEADETRAAVAEAAKVPLPPVMDKDGDEIL